MAEMSDHAVFSRKDIRKIVVVAFLTAAGIWATVALQAWVLTVVRSAAVDSNAVCVAIAASYNQQLFRQQSDTIVSPLDSLPFVSCGSPRRR
jgi:hypothetical protein